MVTYRPEDVPGDSLLLRLSSRMPGGSAGIRLSLRPLTASETSRLVSSMLDGSPMSAEFTAFLHQRTDGIPLVAEELVRLMHDRADLARRGGEWVRRNLDEITVPATIRDGVLERTARLDEDARAVLAAAAVLGYPADERMLRAVAGLTERRADAALTELVGSGLLVQDRGGLVSFRHVLAERAVYESVVHVVAGSVAEQNYVLRAGQLQASASSLSVTERPGASQTRGLTFTNHGSEPAQVTLGEQDGGFTTAAARSSGVASSAAPQAAPGIVSPAAGPILVKKAASAAKSAAAQPQTAPADQTPYAIQPVAVTMQVKP